jgi:pectate lyase
MKKIVIAFLLLLSISQLNAQQIWSEDFQSYNGFGETPTGWTTTIGGFNVKLRTLKLNPDSSAKFVEAILSNNRKRDSIITPSFGPITANTILTFKSRLVDSYTGI